jgi:hypothetical protein
MNKWFGIIGGSLLVTALFSGCSTPSTGIVIDSYVISGDGNEAVTVKSADGSEEIYTANTYLRRFDRRFEIIKVGKRERNGLLQPQVVLQNTTYKELAIEYRFTWLDADGMVIKTPLTTWMPVNASANEKLYIKTLAPVKDAADFECSIRYREQSPRWKFKMQKEKEQI